MMRGVVFKTAAVAAAALSAWTAVADDAAPADGKPAASAAETAPPAAAPAPTAENPAPAEESPVSPPAAVLDPAWLTDLAQELYWWYLDEDVLDLEKTPTFDFSVRRLSPKLDEDDKSEWAEVRVPPLSLGVVAKRPDYSIPETGQVVRGDRFRLVNVFRIADGAAPTDGFAGGPWRKIELSTDEMLKRVYGRLKELRFPDPELADRILRACRRQLELLGFGGLDAEEQVIHVAPLSDVANEVWIYVENQCRLIQLTTDRDLENPEGWDWRDLRARVWNLVDGTVSSLDEMPGSNVVMTLDQAGRALYNSVVLGKRIVTLPPETPGAKPQSLERIPAGRFLDGPFPDQSEDAGCADGTERP